MDNGRMRESPHVAGVLTARSEHYRAVRGLLVDTERLPFSWGGGIEHGWLPGTPWRVVLGLVDGEKQAAAALIGEIGELDPSAVFSVGTASCLGEDMALGDVLVATSVHDHQTNTPASGGLGTQQRCWEPPEPLLRTARAVLRDGRWLRYVSQDDTGLAASSAGRPVVHFEPLASGGASTGSAPGELISRLRHGHGAVVAVDDGTGRMVVSANPDFPRHTMVVCDIGHRLDVAEQRTHGAIDARFNGAAHAAAVVIAVIAGLVPSRRGDKNVCPSLAQQGEQPLGRTRIERHYGGDHFEFNGFYSGSVTGKFVDRRRGTFRSGGDTVYRDGGQSS
ncbi:hypothetical protein AB0K89_11440 [Streptomyces cinnamoneus]|uniref:phosphorylase family protein n=1 Tax=Streptomyces cinnamoneus TaxID=53446 RepID=UPI003448BCED